MFVRRSGQVSAEQTSRVAMQVGRLSQQLPSSKCDLAAMAAFLSEQLHEISAQDPGVKGGGGDDDDDFLT